MKFLLICMISCAALATAQVDADYRGEDFTPCSFFKYNLLKAGERGELQVNDNFEKECNKVADRVFGKNEAQKKKECLKLCTDEEYKEFLKHHLKWWINESRHFGGWPPKVHTTPKRRRVRKPTHKKQVNK